MDVQTIMLFFSRVFLETFRLYIFSLHDTEMSYKQVKFEVTGKVQGVFFRKYAKKICDKHGVHGWVLNTDHKSVQGLLEGMEPAVRSVKHWLQKVGSPRSRVDSCLFLDEKFVDRKQYSKFDVVRSDEEVRRKTFKTT